MDNSDVLPYDFKPHIGQESCWFGKKLSKFLTWYSNNFSTESSSKGIVLFFLIPVGLQITANSLLFILSAYRYKSVMSQISQVQENTTGDKRKSDKLM